MTFAFIDTETTGLGDDDHVWEIYCHRRNAGVARAQPFHVFVHHSTTKASRLPQRYRDDVYDRFDVRQAVTPRSAAFKLFNYLHPLGSNDDPPHLVGANPAFDARVLGRLLTSQGLEVPWHYHLIDIEAMALGYLAAQGRPVEVPFRSDALSRHLGIEPPTPDRRHTAEHDTKWVIDMFDAMNPARRTPGGAP